MIVAIASGKGGTGKTTVAVNLALTLASHGHRTQLLDADVEEPNAALFLPLEKTATTPVTVPLPVVDEAACTLCGTCTSFCRFAALVRLGEKILVLPELCHACGGCTLVCPENAISESPRQVGVVTTGCVAGRPAENAPLAFAEGRMNVGEARAVPLIQALKARSQPADWTIIDAPPGTSCPMLEAVRDADLICLVAEPTPFGLHDLMLVVDAARQMEKPLGVIINRVGLGDDRVHRYLASEKIECLAEIPDDRRIAEASSRGECLVDALPHVRATFDALAARFETRRTGRPPETRAARKG